MFEDDGMIYVRTTQVQYTIAILRHILLSGSTTYFELRSDIRLPHYVRIRTRNFMSRPP
jgi:hypothetical protein